VVTSLALAGFEVAFAFPFKERFSGLGLTALAGSAASDPVVTSFSLAGFAGGRRPHAPGGRNPESRSLSDRLRPSPDAPRSLARCAAVAIRVVPGQSLVAPFQIKIRNRIKIKIKGSGQECPLYATCLFWHQLGDG
jgi:hypothetical protein